jgi:hypothetical protein
VSWTVNFTSFAPTFSLTNGTSSSASRPITVWMNGQLTIADQSNDPSVVKTINPADEDGTYPSQTYTTGTPYSHTTNPSFTAYDPYYECSVPVSSLPSPGGTSAVYSDPDTDSYTGTVIVPADAFNWYEGLGTSVLIVGGGYDNSANSAPSNWSAHYVWEYSGSVSVSYTYATVPEPSALVLLGFGAISLLAYAWRRRRTA